jgi:NAD(P)H-hydrate repair Nnr-like enzyme with NAD(P)H-hydrate epimerase domain
MLSVLPEFFEPIGRNLGVSHCVHDILVAHVVLGCSGVNLDRDNRSPSQNAPQATIVDAALGMGVAGRMGPLGDAFIKLIRMLIAPIIFCTVVTGIAHLADMARIPLQSGSL